ncbi:hypothetical protein D3C80_2090470 [compost metagenome]
MSAAHISADLHQPLSLPGLPHGCAHHPAVLRRQKRIADRFAERLILYLSFRSSHITIILPKEVKDTFFSPKLKL